MFYGNAKPLNSNISTQYGEPVPLGKPNSFLEVVIFPWTFVWL